MALGPSGPMVNTPGYALSVFSVHGALRLRSTLTNASFVDTLHA